MKSWRSGNGVWKGSFVLIFLLVFFIFSSCDGGGGPVTFLLKILKQGEGTVTSTPAGINCGTDCEERYGSGTQVTLNASPAQGWQFSGWSGDCSGTNQQIQVTMNANKTCTATFTQIQYSLTVQVNGQGTVISNPAGINCPGDCDENYNSGTIVVLTAQPAQGWQFDGWSGDADCADGQVTMDANKTCTATFSRPTLTVNINGNGTGTVTSQPAGINCPGDCTEDYEVNTQVTLEAVADPTSRFDGWGGDCSGTGPQTQVTMDANKTCTATFNLEGSQIYGSVEWDTGSPVGGAQVLVKTEDGLVQKSGSTDSNGNYAIGITDTTGNNRVLARVDYSQAGKPPVTGFKWSVEKTPSANIPMDKIILPNPEGAELVGGAGNFENSDRSIQVIGAPGNVANMWARSYDPDEGENEEVFPGEFSEGENIPLNSTVFVWMVAQDADGNPMVGPFAPPAIIRLKVPSSQWQDLEDLTPGQNDGISIPIYSYNYDNGYWERRQNGILTDENGNPIPEGEEANIRNGTYLGNVFAQFQADHFSWWNVDYPGPCEKDFGDAPDPTYPSLLVSNGARHLTTCRAWLGRWVDNENNADVSDLDYFDDSILGVNPLTVRVSNYDWLGTLYLNVLSDENNDGDWDDPDEWVVINQAVNIPIRRGESIATPFNWDERRWIRITLTGAQIPTIPQWTGTGEFEIGETEDYRIRKYALNVWVMGKGTVTSNPVGIDCREGSTTGCYAEFPRDSQVTLTATADPGETFIVWYSDCSDAGNNPTCNLVMDADKLVGAEFSRPPKIWVWVRGNGTVTSDPPGIDCRAGQGEPGSPDDGSQCVAEFPRNSNVTLTATPDPGETFIGWKDDCSFAGNNPTCNLVMDADKYVGADFTLVLTVNIIGQGDVNINPPNTDCTPETQPCTGHYSPGTAVTLTATPDTDWEFVRWEGGACWPDTQNPCNIVLGTDTTVTARFRSLALMITTTSPLPDAFVNQSYTVYVDATGGTKPYTWSKVSGTNDGWLTFTQEGNRYKLTGTPTAEGTTNLRLRVADSSIPQQSDEKDFVINIRSLGVDDLAIQFKDECGNALPGVWAYLTEPRTEEQISGDGGTVLFTSVGTPYTVTWGYSDNDPNTQDRLDTARITDPAAPRTIVLTVEGIPREGCPGEPVGTGTARIAGTIIGVLGDAGQVSSTVPIDGTSDRLFDLPLDSAYRLDVVSLPDDGTPIPYANDAVVPDMTAPEGTFRCLKYGLRRGEQVRKDDNLTGRDINLNLLCTRDENGNFTFPAEFTQYHNGGYAAMLNLAPEGVLWHFQWGSSSSTPQSVPPNFSIRLPSGIPFQPDDRYFYPFQFIFTENDRGTSDPNDDITRLVMVGLNKPGADPVGDVRFLSLANPVSPSDGATGVPLVIPFQWNLSDPNDPELKFVDLEIECVNRIIGGDVCPQADEVVWGIHLQGNPENFTLPDLSLTSQKPPSLGLFGNVLYSWRTVTMNFDLNLLLQGIEPEEQPVFKQSGWDGIRFTTAP